MNERPTQNQVNEAFSKSCELDPTPECWGMLAYSDAPPMVCGSGVGSFQWFPAEAELVSFIRDYMAWWHPAPSSMEPEEIAAQVQSIVDAESADLPKMVDGLNEIMRNMWHIEWCGQFRDLCESTDEFPAKIRSSFCEDSDLPDAVLQEVMDEFVEYLRSYGF